MMDYIDCCRRYVSAKKVSDSMGLNYLSNIDVTVCDFVHSQLSYVDFNRFSSGRFISIKELVEMSINEMNFFGSDISKKIDELVNNTLINQKKNIDITQFSASISYDINNGAVSSIGSIHSYNIPQCLYEYSVYLFSHEHLHALKETNYLEWKDSNIIGEVIPLFYELVVSESDDILKRQLLKARMNDLFYNGCEFSITNDLIMNGNNEEDINLYLYVRTIIGRYLNSFYYALILYSMYKETPLKILDLVSKVLRHEMTTLDMLNRLNIYGDIRGELVEKELNKIKKKIK